MKQMMAACTGADYELVVEVEETAEPFADKVVGWSWQEGELPIGVMLIEQAMLTDERRASRMYRWFSYLGKLAWEVQT